MLFHRRVPVMHAQHFACHTDCDSLDFDFLGTVERANVFS